MQHQGNLSQAADQQVTADCIEQHLYGWCRGKRSQRQAATSKTLCTVFLESEALRYQCVRILDVTVIDCQVTVNRSTRIAHDAQPRSLAPTVHVITSVHRPRSQVNHHHPGYELATHPVPSWYDITQGMVQAVTKERSSYHHGSTCPQVQVRSEPPSPSTKHAASILCASHILPVLLHKHKLTTKADPQ
jgi:hypothetical protein